MSDLLYIDEIIRKAMQGNSGPYICRGSDNRQYFVKSSGAGRSSQCYEVVCAELARLFGLPVPEYKLAWVEDDLISELPCELSQIGSGMAFASLSVSTPLSVSVADVEKIDERTRQDIVVFDWWIRNLDRSDFNTNLLWSGSSDSLFVIDHNLAFDREFDRATFLAQHLFRDDFERVRRDMYWPQEYAKKFTDCVEQLDSIFGLIPDEWHWIREEGGAPSDIDLEFVREVLTSYENLGFWEEGE